MNELHTIRDFLRWAVTTFNQAQLYYGHGTDNAWDDALALILKTLSLPHDISPSILDATLTLDERKTLTKLIQKRVEKRIPVPYLTHEAWFAGLPFYVDERVLIPRSPIAELIENHFEPWLQEPPETILDLCTGSGCIAIACAYAFPDCQVDASDISADALEVCKKNIAKHHVEQQVNIYQSDLFKNLPAKKYDLIVSNPPYVDKTDMSELPAEYHHEPRLALAAGEDGLSIALPILREAMNYLTPDGIIILEVGNSEVALAEKFKDIPFTWIDFQKGGGGVMMLTYDQLKMCNI